MKLGKSDVEVTRLGIGAWAWGDTTYWNDFQWDGKIYLVSLNFVCTGSFFFSSDPLHLLMFVGFDCLGGKCFRPEIEGCKGGV